MVVTDLKILQQNDPRWTSYVQSHPDTTIFHQSDWIELLSACYGYKAELLTLQDSSNKIIAALPLMQVNSRLTGKRLVSVPFSDFCQPLLDESTPLQKLVTRLQSWRIENRIGEIRIHWPLNGLPGIHHESSYARHITYLEPDSQNLFKRFAKSQVQKNIRLAERKGVEIFLRHQWKDMESFYGLHLETRRRLGTPVQPFRFFRILWERLISKGDGFILLAYKDAQLLAGAIFLHSNKSLIYKYGASNPNFWTLRPNNLLFWRAICLGCDHGYQFFDWGRTALHPPGLRKFKLGWCSEEQIIHYSILSERPPRLMENSKLAAIVATIIKNSPTWVGRLIGEALYSHFG